MLIINLKETDTVDKALKKYKKKFEKTGVMRELRERQAYTKPSIKRRKEMIKKELHEILKRGFGVSRIHSEYSMTELLSQAYSKGEGVFKCPPWMQILIRDPEDPLTLFEGKTGGINVIDLANIHSCSFIATQDLGRVNADGSFEILGRFDTSDIRGCNLMVL